MILYRSYCLMFLICLGIQLSSQDTLEQTIIRGLNMLRENTLVSHLPLLIELAKVAKKLENTEKSLSGMDIISLINNSYNPNYPDLKPFFKRFNNRYDINLEKKNISAQDIETILQNQDFISLITLKILHSEYPFKLTGNTFIIKEFKSCYLDFLEDVAEIGCGDGFFGYLLSWIFQPKSYTFNEIVPGVKVLMDKRKASVDSIANFTKMEFVVGNEEETNLLMQYDKILIRNSFHHFSKKDKMLQAIRENLKENGTLIIIEAFKNLGNYYPIEFVPGDYSCRKKLTHKKFDKYLTSNGFQLLDSVQIGPRTVLRFKKVPLK